MKEAVSYQALEDQFGLEVYPKRDVTIVRGEGALLWDESGREYIDCAAGIGVASVGHANPDVADAIAAQAKRLITCPGIFYNDTRSQLLERLVALAPAGLERAFLCNSGSEAIEGAFKAARHSTGRAGIVAAMRGYHGRTMGALSATFRKEYREPFQPLPDGFSFAPFNNSEKLKAAVTEDTAAVVLEPVQGEGGVRPGNCEFFRAAREVCDEMGALLIVDEIQTGFCRTGSFFASEQLGLKPDIMCVAKAMAGGVPMGAMLVNEKIKPLRGLHGSTFGGNPLACAAALAAINFMEREGLSEQARIKGARFVERLAAADVSRVRDVRQLGLMIGIEMKERVQPFLIALMERGVLALPAGPTVLRLLPPLVINDDQIDRVASAVREVLSAE